MTAFEGVGEACAVDPELRDAFERLTSDLRAEVQSGDAELRDALGQLAVDLCGEIRAGDAETRAYVNSSAAELRAHLEAATTEMRRHSDVIGEALGGDIRSLAGLMAISNERVGPLSSASRSR